MVKVKMIQDGYMYPKGKILSLSKADADEAVKENIGVMIDEKYVEGVGIVEEKESKFNEKDVRKFYRFFNHTKPTEIRVFDAIKYPNGKSVFVKNEDEFVKKCKYYCDEKVSVYIGARDRKAKGDKNVTSSHFIFFEIDRYGKDKDNEKNKILNFLQENNVIVGMQGMSGGGWHFYIPHKMQEFKNSEEAFSYKELSLNSFKKVFLSKEFDIDPAVFNLERVTRVLGTFNCKRNKISNIDYIKNINLDENTQALQLLLKKYKELPSDNKRYNKTIYNPEDDAFIKNIKEKWKEGDRQSLALSLAGYLRKEKRLGLKNSLEIIKNICMDCNDEEINQRLSAVKTTYEKDESEIKGFAGLDELGIKPSLVKSFSSSDEDKKEVKQKPNIVKSFLIIKYDDETGEEISRKVDIDAIAKFIENKFNIRTIYGLKEETIEVYNEGIWTVKGRGIIKGEIERILGKYSRNNIVNEILEKIKRRTEVDREDVDVIPDFKRCVENGVLDLENIDDIKFLPHSKYHNFRSKFPIKYNKNSKCPTIISFIEKAFYKDDVKLIQEWFGFHLIRRYSFKKAMILHGPKNTSKTVVLNLLTKFLGGNVSGLSIQEISIGKPFDLKDLKDKDANICDDLSSRDMKAVGGFKKAVGDGYIDGEYKFGDKIRFRNTAKDTNACNTIPLPQEDIDDEAYYDRILLTPMDNVIPKEKRDKNLIDKLTNPNELSGLLNWAIEGYERLVTQNYFTNEKEPEETKFLMIQNGNSLAKFSTEVLKQQDGAKISKDYMYTIYCKWCSEHKPQLSPDTKEKIGRKLNGVAPFIQASSTGKERYWLNVKTTYTYDTSKNNMSHFLGIDNNNNITSKNNIYKFSKSVISVSKNDKKDSNDTFLQKDISENEENTQNIPKLEKMASFDTNKLKLNKSIQSA